MKNNYEFPLILIDNDQVLVIPKALNYWGFFKLRQCEKPLSNRYLKLNYKLEFITN